MSGFFARFVQRIWSPEIESSRRQTTDAQRQAEFWRNRYRDEAVSHDDLKRLFKKEIESNRRREDGLRNQILTAHGAHSLPTRESLPALPEPKAETVSKSEEEILRARAVNYCEQTLGKFTNTDVEETYQQMLLKPNDWLTD